MNYEQGLETLKRMAQNTNWYGDFVLQEARLRENLAQARRYGDTETRRAERAQIIEQLNALALAHLGTSFNDLCLGQQPPSQPASHLKGDGEPTGPEPRYGTGHRWAVLVGVNEYEDQTNYGRLHVCVKDVHAIRDQLVAGGFDPARIRLLTDDTPELPTRDNILVALKAVADATEPDDLLLFYYSGHGDEDGGESYLVARNGRRLVLRDTAVLLSRVREIVEQAPARAKVIVLDACHSGADIGGKGPRPMSAGFIRRVFEQAEGLAILASCKQGQLSYEWREHERSVFTHFLLEALQGEADRDGKGFVTVQDASRHVTNGVKLWASQRNVSQTPTLEGKLAGDIILAERRSQSVVRGGSSLAFIGPAGATRPPAPEEQGPAAEPNPPAQGGRSVTVNGDVSGSIIVTGDGNVIATPPGSPTPPAAADREGLERALAMARRALAILEEQAAGFTALTIPAHLKIELEEKRREVAELERHLQG